MRHVFRQLAVAFVPGWRSAPSHVLWLVAPRQMKYKASQVVDTFLARSRRSCRSCVRFCAASLAFVAALSPLTVSAKSEEPRPKPNYDGRAGAGQPTTAGDVALWVPRVVLFPAYVVSEYVIRRPLGAAITAAEKARVPTILYDFFAFGPDHKAGVVPIAFIEFGFLPSVGVYAFWDDAGFKGHSLRLRGSTWGPEWLGASVTDRIQINQDSSLTLNGTFIHRPDFAYFGEGPNSRQEDLSRYGADIADMRAVWRVGLWRSSALETSVGYRGLTFRPGNYSNDPSLPVRAASGAFAIPDGYEHGYNAPFHKTTLTLDTRPEHALSETGLRLSLDGEQGADLSRASGSGWRRYGGTLGGFLDLGDRGRILSLSFATEMADPTGPYGVPFTELAQLGGNDKMPGFRPGRLYGRSSAVATLRYSWPIWIWLDGSLQAAVGNVFGEHLSGASVSSSRFSGAVGIESRGSKDSVFQLLFGMGTEPFDNGAKLNSFRVVAGARSGF